MNYLLTGQDDEALERLVQQELLTITYRGRHTPVLAVESELSREELQAHLPGYTVDTPKTYHTNDTRQP